MDPTSDPAPENVQPDPVAVVHWWESRVRRILLVAHVLPALFGLVAVLGADDPRTVDVATWSFVVAWTLLILGLGWRRRARTRFLVLWILADALVMAGLMFIGTSAREVVVYVAVDGALFAAMFASAPAALLQVAIVYSGLVAGAVARANGSTLATALVGWQTPLLVTLAGILALRFLRSALDRLGATLAARAATTEEERRVLTEAAIENTTARNVAAIQGELHGPLAELERLVGAYAAISRLSEEGKRESSWLLESTALARRELEGLRSVVEVDGEVLLAGIVEAAIAAAAAAHPHAPPVTTELSASAAAEFRQPRARAVAGFVREGVANALAHGAAPIVVAVRQGPRGLEIVISDGGSGPDHGGSSDGLGTRALAEHARAAGGEIIRFDPSDGEPHRLVLVLGQVAP